MTDVRLAQRGAGRGSLCCLLLPLLGLAACPVNACDPPEPPGGVAAGARHSCAIDVESALHCWGDPDDVALLAAPAIRARSVVAGERHSCALDEQGQVHCWGDDRKQQLQAPPAAMVKLAARGDQSCGLDVDGGLHCWGEALAVTTEPALSDLGMGLEHGCGIARDDQSLRCWGDDRFGQASPPAGRFTALAVGSYFACALRSDAIVVCWGLGDHDQNVAPEGRFVSLSAGFAHACAVDTDSQVRCWGWDLDGQAQDPAGSWARVSAGARHSCAQRRDGRVACWGAGELDGTCDADHFSCAQSQVPPALQVPPSGA